MNNDEILKAVGIFTISAAAAGVVIGFVFFAAHLYEMWGLIVR